MLDHLLQRGEEVAAICTFLGLVLGGFYRFLLRPVYHRLEALAQDVAAVRSQVENNGGSSMKDAVERTERVVSALDKRMDGVSNDLSRLTGRFDEHARITNH